MNERERERESESCPLQQVYRGRQASDAQRITSDTGDATVKSMVLPSIVRQHSRSVVVETSMQGWGSQVGWRSPLWSSGQASFAVLACNTAPETYSMK